MQTVRLGTVEENRAFFCSSEILIKELAVVINRRTDFIIKDDYYQLKSKTPLVTNYKLEACVTVLIPQ